MKKYFSPCILKSHALHLVILIMVISLSAFSQDGENRFIDHGVASPISNHRGTVATVDGNGQNVVLIWLYDHTTAHSAIIS